MAEEWYYTQQGQQVGPVSGQQLKQLAGGGWLPPGELVWKEGMSDWVPASSVPGLFAPQQLTAGQRPVKAPRAGGQSYENPDRHDPSQDEDEDARQESRRPRRKKKKKAKRTGIPFGLKIGLIVGGSVLGVGVLLVLFIMVLMPLLTLKSYSGSYSLNLPPGQNETHTTSFKKGHWVTVKVANQSLGEFSVMVLGPAGDPVFLHGNENPRNPLHHFEAREDGDYTIWIHNVGLAPGSCVVTYQVK